MSFEAATSGLLLLYNSGFVIVGFGSVWAKDADKASAISKFGSPELSVMIVLDCFAHFLLCGCTAPAFETVASLRLFVRFVSVSFGTEANIFGNPSAFHSAACFSYF